MNEKSKRSRFVGTTLLMLLAAACASAALPGSDLDDHSSSAAAGTVFGISKPSQELKLTFAAAGIISNVSVKQGEVVKAGQILATQDNSQDLIAADVLKVDAESTDEITYSIADEKEKQVLLDRKKDMMSKGVATVSEVEDADLAVQLAAARVKLANQEHQKKGFEYKKQLDKLEHMTLKSPIDGVVRRINIGPGEMADPQSREGAIVVTAWDPIWIEANPATAESKELQLGQTLEVQFEGDKDKHKAKIIFLDQFDYGSESRLIRLEYPNKDLKPPGLRVTVTVTLPEKASRH
jgi:multidrug efflux pump subunit AcrA (membrane-fusion protein)